MKKLAIITTHPIQYNAPFFALLAKRSNVEVKVFYTWGNSVLNEKYDGAFAQSIQWDIPLLEGYAYEFQENKSNAPGSHHFFGIINPGLIERITKYSPSALLIYGWSFFSHAKLIRHFYGKIPVFFRGDSIINCHDGIVKSIGKKILLKYLFGHIDKVFFTGDKNKAYFRKYGVSEQKLIYAPHAVDNTRFSDTIYDEQIIEQRRSKCGIVRNDIVIIYAGKFIKKKNLSFAIHLFKQIKTQNLKLILAGDGPEKLYLQNIAGNDSRIKFLPFENQSTMPLLYRMADIFMLPSNNYTETWGLSINEAMASGLAIMVSNRAGCATELVDKKNGHVFDPEDSGSCVEFIQYILNNPVALAEMKRNSKEKIKCFSYQEFVDVLEEAVNNV